MAATISWLNDLGQGQEKARQTNKPILVDFFNPQWIGCQQMGAVTYPDPKVVEFINNNFVPVQIPASNATMMQQYNVSWTPTLLVLDAQGKEHFRRVGFFDANDLVSHLMTGKGRYYLDKEQYAEAMAMFKVVQELYPGTEAAAEAVFFQGVCGYKMTHDPKALRAAYDTLTEKYAGSQWTKQAKVYERL